MELGLAQAHIRAINCWIVGFCADPKGGLLPIPQTSLPNHERAAEGLRRAIAAHGGD